MLATNEQQDDEAACDSIHASDKPVPTPLWHVAQTRDSKQGTGEDLQAVHQQEAQAGDNTHVDGEHHLAEQQQQKAEQQQVAQARDSKQGTGEDLQAVHRQETQAGYNKHVYGEHHMAEQQQHNAEQQQVAQAQDSKRETGDDRQAVHQQEVQSQAFLLPHEMLAAIYNDYPEMWRTIISSDVTTLVDFWNDQTGHSPSDETETPAQQHGAQKEFQQHGDQEETEESRMSDDTNELFDRVMRVKRRRRRSSSTSSSEKYSHRKIKKQWVSLGATTVQT